MKKKNPYLLPIILVTSLFFLWGFSYGLVDVLNKHFQNTLKVTKQDSMLVQLAYFGAYFAMALPAGLLMQKIGYRKGIIIGLLLYAVGALLFYPSSQSMNFSFFLISLFIIASGLTFLETAANPYITVLGKPERSEFRLNLSQSFNGVGAFLGPIVAAEVFFGNKAASEAQQLSSVKFVYIGIAIVVLIVALLFVRTPMPEIKEEELVVDQKEHTGKSLFQHSHFVWAVVAQFFYVAAQVGIAGLFINYCTEHGLGITDSKASYILAISLALFTIGRFVGTAIMKVIAPNKLLGFFALANIVLSVVVMQVPGWLSIYALIGIYFFESIMFPTIFALGVKNLGRHTKKGASFIIMSIVGGAVVPYVMGTFATDYSTSFSFIIPLVCFVVVAIFAFHGYKIKSHK